MAIDYSKWDKIELSDDSDIEVHPNVDKRSFIKWKQQSIHEKRLKRNQDIKNLETQINMYASLNRRVDKLLENLKDSDLVVKDTLAKFLNANFDKHEKSMGDNVDPDIPSYNEMVEDLFEQLERDAKNEGKDPKDGAVIRQLVLKHRQKIDNVTVEAKKKLEQLYIEKNSSISSEDIKPGFDSGFMNKKESAVEEKVAENLQKAAAKTGIGSPVPAVDLPSLPANFIEYEDVMELAPETEAFGEIASSDYAKSEEYLLKHMPIISEQQKDALMMKAFEYQMKGDEESTYRVIHQSELIAYIREIYDMKKITGLVSSEMEQVIEMFFERVVRGSNLAGKQSFLQSVQAKFDHVKNRVRVMEQEHENEQEGVETIELKSLDESTELEVNLPDFKSEDPAEVKRVEAFQKLPQAMQDAIKTKNLDKVNEVFAEIPIKEAEEYLELFNEADIIGVKALLETEEDFKQLQNEYESQNKLEDLSLHGDAKPEDKNEELSSSEAVENTADVVD
ncbi:hypothetical protein HG536_0C00950 [Torulaspora globosa]|uniref:Hsp90 chaperone protein kinase-targeting subunit n=1 Tax=Torulaspora globosa TaxID=48254 RepID=A0A7G3ZEJ2_9SACH|nr:uncharacterized protein HG536_0C00950 [Torulaspora globosa]QLL31928.1 hypothetical protein HG536_0C00950 [Torulaspora globosa]